jgi:hypothetical protein
MKRTVIPTGNFLVKRKNLFIRTERPWFNEKFYRGVFVRRLAQSDYSIFEEAPSPTTYFAGMRVEAWDPVGETTEEIFNEQTSAAPFPQTIMVF